MTMEEKEQTPPTKASSPTNSSIPEAVSPNSSQQAAPLLLSPPPYQAVTRDDPAETTRCCRICLEEDDPQDLIAPCRCSGSSKWVHRQCLDQWRIHETDRAFSQCTECLFNYHMQPINRTHPTSPEFRRKTKYCLLVSRDLCLATIVLQVVIVVLGALVWAMDDGHALPQLINPHYPEAVYYLMGFLLALILLGVFGLITLCGNGCSIQASLDQYRAPIPRNGDGTPVTFDSLGAERQQSYAERVPHYRALRRQRRRQPSPYADDRGCCLCCNIRTPVYCVGDGQCCNDCCFYCLGVSSDGDCCACCTDTGSSSTSCDCCPSSNDCGGDGAEVILILLVVFAVFLAIVGFLVGIVIVVIMFQRTMQRHLYILHKRQLTREFQVRDLSGFDLQHPLVLPTTRATQVDNDVESAAVSRPTAPTLSEADSAYLKKIGLMER